MIILITTAAEIADDGCSIYRSLERCGGGKAHSRIYDDENVARKAKKWLMENGAQNIDIAVRINKKQTEEEKA